MRISTWCLKIPAGGKNLEKSRVPGHKYPHKNKIIKGAKMTILKPLKVILLEKMNEKGCRPCLKIVHNKTVLKRTIVWLQIFCKGVLQNKQ